MKTFRVLRFRCVQSYIRCQGIYDEIECAGTAAGAYHPPAGDPMIRRSLILASVSSGALAQPSVAGL